MTDGGLLGQLKQQIKKQATEFIGAMFGIEPKEVKLEYAVVPVSKVLGLVGELEKSHVCIDKKQLQDLLDKWNEQAESCSATALDLLEKKSDEHKYFSGITNGYRSAIKDLKEFLGVGVESTTKEKQP